MPNVSSDYQQHDDDNWWKCLEWTHTKFIHRARVWGLHLPLIRTAVSHHWQMWRGQKRMFSPICWHYLVKPLCFPLAPICLYVSSPINGDVSLFLPWYKHLLLTCTVPSWHNQLMSCLFEKGSTCTVFASISEHSSYWLQMLLQGTACVQQVYTDLCLNVSLAASNEQSLISCGASHVCVS